MDLFKLPATTRVNRVIPKNAFDAYTNTKQKKIFTDLISRIAWTHKLSPQTINLEAKEIKEIQVFHVELKTMAEVKPVLDIIDKSIPYHIIFLVEYNGQIYLSTSTKHPHPVNENNSVIDWTFKTEWFPITENGYTLVLKKSLDAVHHDFCIQISGQPTMSNKPIQELIEYKRRILTLEKEIVKLKTAITGCKQFNQKVELNIKLKTAENQLLSLISKN
jgi:Fe-S cluster biosynthesis and repair protein YggX